MLTTLQIEDALRGVTDLVVADKQFGGAGSVYFKPRAESPGLDEKRGRHLSHHVRTVAETCQRMWSKRYRARGSIAVSV